MARWLSRRGFLELTSATRRSVKTGPEIRGRVQRSKRSERFRVVNIDKLHGHHVGSASELTVCAAQVDGLTRLMLEDRKGPGDDEENMSPKRRGNRRDTWAPGLKGA